MRIKTKLFLGIGVMFFMIVILGAVSARYLYKLKAATENVLIANYNTLQYSRNILLALEKAPATNINVFEENLHKQENNITEKGEKEVTEALRKSFENHKNNPDNEIFQSQIRKNIFEIMDMNMQAIQRKSEIAEKTAYNAVLWIAATGFICFVIALLLLINLPSNIANPIKELTESIKLIAAKKYSERVHFQGLSEFEQLAKSFNTMAEKLEQYNNSNLAKLMVEKKRIETLIDKMHDPVIGLDEKMCIIFANEEANHILGLSDEELIGCEAKDLALKNDLLRELIKDINVVPNPNASVQPIKIYANGKEGYFEKDIQHIKIVPPEENEHKVIGHVILLKNVTEYKELDFAKTNFIATVSHEFKTPISSIKMSLQLLENKQTGNLNEEQKSLVEGIKEDATRLLKITGELLNITQAESGNIQLSILPANPQEVLQYAINATKNQADQKQITLLIDCPENVPNIQADKEKTAWILTNIISNAIRYSYENSSIYLAIKEMGEDIMISVKDTGQGIAPQYKEKVFDRYFRVPGTKKEGTGLGLAISKEFIEAQGGKITIESEFGAGSTFSIFLKKAKQQHV